MADKIPISLNDVEKAKIRELADLIGIAGVYGETPKAIKFSIGFALSAIKNPSKVYSVLDDSELDIYFQSIKRAEQKQRLLEKALELEKQAQKV